MSFWRTILLVCLPVAGGSAAIISWGLGSYLARWGDWGALGWAPLVAFIGGFSLWAWKRAEPRETWDKTVSAQTQKEAEEWLIEELKKNER